MQDAQHLLEQLHDIELPGGGWPVAPGWILLGLLLCLLLVVLLRWGRRPRRHEISTDWQTVAEAELQRIEQQLQAGQTEGLLSACSQLARRISIARTQRAEVAGLTGQLWLEKLDQLSNSHFFTQQSGKLLESGPYQKHSAVDAQQLKQIVAQVRLLIEPASKATT